jgi:hypothetical protein
MTTWAPETEAAAMAICNRLAEATDVLKKTAVEQAPTIEAAAMGLALYAIGTAEQAAGIASINLGKTQEHRERLYDSVIEDVRKMLLSRRREILNFSENVHALHAGHVAGRA